MGIVGDEGFTFRKSVDTDIQKASYAYSEKEHENIGDDCHYGFQGLKAQAAHYYQSPFNVKIRTVRRKRQCYLLYYHSCPAFSS